MDSHLLLLRRRKLILTLLVDNINKRERTKWVKRIFLKRRQQGDFHNLLSEMRLHDHEGFFNYLRMETETFDELLRLVGPKLMKKETRWRKPISPAERLACTLRFLSTGCSMIDMSYSFRLGHSTVSQIVRETSEAIWEVLMPLYVKAPRNENEWTTIAKDFWEIWNFPNCCGALDGKHCVIQAPSNGGSLFYNYKGAHSVVLMAVCDANYCFTLLDIGDSGHHSDGGVFANSDFGKALVNGRLNLPKPRQLPGSRGLEIPYVFVGDEAFPLKENLMRPFPGTALDLNRRIYNYRLSRARRIIENAFGILAARFRIFRKPIVAEPNNVISFIKAACALHNFLKITDERINNEQRRYCPPKYSDYVDAQGIERDGQWRSEETTGLIAVGPLGSNHGSMTANAIREEFVRFVNSPQGSLSYQKERVLMGSTPIN